MKFRISARSIVFISFVLLVLSGCSCCTFKIKAKCLCFNGRRPQVMNRVESCVADYTPDCCENDRIPPIQEIPPPQEQEDPILEWGQGAEVYPNFSPICQEGESCPLPCLKCGLSRECCTCRNNVIPVSPEMLEPASPSAEDYRIAIGDYLEISVFGDEEANANKVVVAPDGNIYYAFLPGIRAAGRTIPEVSNEIASRLEHLFLNPAISIVPRTSVDQRFKILGRVRNSGVYPIVGTMRVRDAIGRAGGLMLEESRDKNKNSDILPLADLSASFLVRNGMKIDIDFEELLMSGNDSQNIVLAPGDYIYIAPLGRQDVYILGAVNTAGSLAYTRSLTLMGALTSASGWIIGGPFGAEITKVLVIRGHNLACPCVAEVDVRSILNGGGRDLYLQPGDIIYVPNKNMRFGRAMVRLAVSSFIESFITGAAGYYGGLWFPLGASSSSDTTSTTNGTTNATTP